MAEVAVFRNVSKVFRDFWHRPAARAVSDFSFTLNQGETLAMLGPNGSGKSTSVRMLLGLLHPTAGEIEVFGRPATDVESKRRVGFLAEETRLHPWMTARETLMFYASLFKLPNAECKKRTDELLEMMGLTQAAHRRIGTFSKGMQRRIGIAQALINDPDFLIFDEPTSGLDPIGIAEIRDLIRLLKSRGKTMLITGHFLPDIEAVCDRVLILYGGRLCLEGTLDVLLTDQHRRRLEFPDIPAEGIAEIRNVISRYVADTQEITEGHPRRSLEALFTDTIEAIRTKERDPGFVNDGVRHAGPAAAYLHPGHDA